MDLNRDRTRRGGIALFVLVLLAIAAYVVVAFVPTVVFAIFLYYAVRPVFRFLDRFPLPRSIRAWLSLATFGIPFLALLGYTFVVLLIEARAFLETRGVAAEARKRIADQLGIESLDVESLRDLVSNGGLPPLDPVVDVLFDGISLFGGLFLQLILIITAVYYMLVDGPRLRSWFLDTYDDTGIWRAYARAVDPELSATLFGNIVNVFVTAFIAVATFYAYNIAVPEIIEVPFPTLVGVLVGVGTLIPVVGIKLVYVPVVVGVGVRGWLTGDPGLLVPVVILFVVCAVLLDFIPDIVIRAQFSGDETHDGLLILAYITGPTLFGFYGLFLAPIVLILAIHAVRILIPYVLSGEVPWLRQTTLSEFADGEQENG